MDGGTSASEQGALDGGGVPEEASDLSAGRDTRKKAVEALRLRDAGSLWRNVYNVQHWIGDDGFIHWDGRDGLVHWLDEAGYEHWTGDDGVVYWVKADGREEGGDVHW